MEPNNPQPQTNEVREDTFFKKIKGLLIFSGLYAILATIVKILEDYYNVNVVAYALLWMYAIGYYIFIENGLFTLILLSVLLVIFKAVRK
jgi:hypothetical protein